MLEQEAQRERMVQWQRRGLQRRPHGPRSLPQGSVCLGRSLGCHKGRWQRQQEAFHTI